MIKAHTVETVEEYDGSGKLLKRTVTETTETDDNPIQYTYTSSPYIPDYPYISYCGFGGNGASGSFGEAK